jgi:hypothetical protein
MATRGKRESWKAKNNMEEDYLAGKNRARMEQLGIYARAVARDRSRWKQCIGALCASGHKEDR